MILEHIKYLEDQINLMKSKRFESEEQGNIKAYVYFDGRIDSYMGVRNYLLRLLDNMSEDLERNYVNQKDRSSNNNG